MNEIYNTDLIKLCDYMKSDNVKKGIQRAPHRSLLRACGLDDEDFKKPFIGIANSFTDIVPGHIHLRDLVEFVKEGIIAAGGIPFEFDTMAVCDGISKTYSLLCNMLGIDCIRVVGQAGVDENKGGHAWNKVKVDGQWYIVDATWGDLTMGFTYKTGGVFGSTSTDYYELGLHNYFLVTDSFVKDNHEEEVENYYTYNLSVEGYHNYIVEGLVAHNVRTCSGGGSD